MTPEEIKLIVKLTVREMLQASDTKEVSTRLSVYFRDGKPDKVLTSALIRLKEDPYIDIIYMYYRDCYTLEVIAEELRRDVSTIKRNKKRLLLELGKKLEET